MNRVDDLRGKDTMEAKLLHGAPGDFEAMAKPAEVGGVMVFAQTLYGAPAVDNWNCPRCGRRNAEGATACEFCGADRRVG